MTKALSVRPAALVKIGGIFVPERGTIR